MCFLLLTINEYPGDCANCFKRTSKEPNFRRNTFSYQVSRMHFSHGIFCPRIRSNRPNMSESNAAHKDKIQHLSIGNGHTGQSTTTHFIARAIQHTQARGYVQSELFSLLQKLGQFGCVLQRRRNRSETRVQNLPGKVIQTIK